MSRKYLTRPTHHGYVSTQGECFICKITFWESKGSYAKKKNHFCSRKCHTEYKKIMPKELHPRWEGGVTQTETHRRWKKKNPERMAFLKARRYARECGAKGSHTFEQWNDLKSKFQNRCANCLQEKPLTKDHIRPLSKGGSDNIQNIQPLCRNCNSKKWATFNIYENPELLNGEGNV